MTSFVNVPEDGKERLVLKIWTSVWKWRVWTMAPVWWDIICLLRWFLWRECRMVACFCVAQSTHSL